MSRNFFEVEVEVRFLFRFMPIRCFVKRFVKLVLDWLSVCFDEDWTDLAALVGLRRTFEFW